jgi:hypothetical protein
MSKYLILTAVDKHLTCGVEVVLSVSIDLYIKNVNLRHYCVFNVTSLASYNFHMYILVERW